MAEQPQRFKWSPASNRYHDGGSGRFVPKATVRAQVDRVVGDSATTMRDLTTQLKDGQITLAKWQAGMAAEVKSAHLAGAAAAKGGWAQMSPSDYGFVGSRIKEQYAYLSKFAEQVASGTQSLDGTALQRAALYGNAGRATNREMERRMGRLAGDGWEQNILGATDSCPGCLDATSQGVVPIGTLTEVGSRDCASNCRCVIETLTDAEAGKDEAA